MKWEISHVIAFQVDAVCMLFALLADVTTTARDAVEAAPANSIAVTAFGYGLLSAVSLPVGAALSAFWRPANRTVAALMAFGGGALLAALTLDLAGPALERGHFHWLAAGCIVGGLLFVGLDRMLNDRGAFLRKAATTVFHLRRVQLMRLRRFLARMRRVALFDHVDPADLSDLADAMFSQHLEAGETLFRDQDVSDHLYVIESGRVELRDPHDAMKVIERLGGDDALGYLAFITGARHSMMAVATEPTDVWMLPHDAYRRALGRSKLMQEDAISFVKSDEVMDYLTRRHGLESSSARSWSDEAARAIQTGSELPHAVPHPEAERQFELAVRHVRRLPIFAQLPDADVRDVASKAICQRHPKGFTFFHGDEPSDRLFIVESGEVTLLKPQDPNRTTETLKKDAAFGALSCLTGTPHTASAVAATDVTVWVLRRSDIDAMLPASPALTQALEEFLQEDRVLDYLRERHHLGSTMTATWVRKALRQLGAGQLIPSASDLVHKEGAPHGAPLAIWLGILLDGIPESFVIGASLLHDSQLRLSLIAGLLLSNFPEALSSSVGMRQQGHSMARIMLMWSSLMLLTGVGAVAGSYLLANSPEWLFSLIEGVAVGAMLTMIAQTMLPEAAFRGGSIVGLSTLLGFLAAVFFKTLDQPGGH